MAKRDGAAVDIHLRRIDPEFPNDGQRLCGERFVQLEQIDRRGCRPARSSTLRTAVIGPMPMTIGSTPVTAYDEYSRQRRHASRPVRSRDSSQSARPRHR